jgi:thioredoxin reductase (NADPH)
LFDSQLALIYPLILLLIWLVYAVIQRRQQSRSAAIWEDNLQAGLTEPMSLHPVINPLRCIGSSSCVSACPEGNVIGMLDGKASLIDPTRCIGHGACAAACPHGAIELVFGTARRGVDIPLLDEQFQTSVPGIYIAGELGGMGLIRNAVTQGKQAMEAIAARTSVKQYSGLQVVVIGAGPAGLSAALTARSSGLRCKVLEQDSLGGTIAHYPRGKVVMTQPVNLPLVGKLQFTRVSKEKLIDFWSGVLKQHPLDIETGVRVEHVEGSADKGFDVLCADGTRIRTASVLLAIGRRGTPRRLDVAGEDQTKVVYRLIDPEQYQGQRVLVVGGGDSALEAAASLAQQPGCQVTLSYRSKAFSRARSRNREQVEAAQEEGRLQVLLESQVMEIESDRVVLTMQGETLVLANDIVIIAAGGLMPTPFLERMGVVSETRYGTAG